MHLWSGNSGDVSSGGGSGNSGSAGISGSNGVISSSGGGVNSSNDSNDEVPMHLLLRVWKPMIEGQYLFHLYSHSFTCTYIWFYSLTYV